MLGIIVAGVLLVVWRARPASATLADEAPRTPTRRGHPHWADEALAFEEAGRWRDGLRCRYRALVSTLAARDVIPDLVGRTAGEFVADVRRNRLGGRPAVPGRHHLLRGRLVRRPLGWASAERDALVERAAEVTAALDVLDAAPAERELVALS